MDESLLFIFIGYGLLLPVGIFIWFALIFVIIQTIKGDI